MKVFEQIENLEMQVLFLNAELILCRNEVDKLSIQKEQLDCLKEIEYLYKLQIAKQINELTKLN